MQGRRRDDPEGLMQPGDYGRIAGTWHCCTPNGHMGNLAQHEVTEHEDGTITVSPSILVTLRCTESHRDRELWHGYLERGVWRAC